MKSLIATVLALACLAITTTGVFASAPHLMTFQGRLLDNAGNPLSDGPREVRIVIWNDPTATAPSNEVWNSGSLTVTTEKGLFSAVLGALPQPAIDPNTMQDSSRWIGITVGADPEMSPRVRLGATPYAWTAQNAAYANQAGSATTFFIGDSALRAYGTGANQFVEMGMGLANTYPWNDRVLQISRTFDSPNTTFGSVTVLSNLGLGNAIGGFFRAAYSGGTTTCIGLSSEANSNAGNGMGVTAKAIGNGKKGYGISARAEDNVDGNIGVWGRAYGSNPSGVYAESYATTTASLATYGVYGKADGGGLSTSTFGVYGFALAATSANYAGYFDGDAHVTGTLTKGGGAFKIDHPLDPENKYLQHSFVESPDMKNIYDGVAVLDAGGQTTVTLPNWFESLNKDFRYQLTCIGGYAPVYVSSEVTNSSFSIAGGTAGLKVSWQVTGIRKDAYANGNRIQVEVDKRLDEKGKYLHPEAFSLDKTRGIEWEQRKKFEDQSAEQAAERATEPATEPARTDNK